MPLGEFPLGTVVRLKKTGEFALIASRNELMGNPESFLNYYLQIEDRPGLWAGYDADLELEALPMENQEDK